MVSTIFFCGIKKVLKNTGTMVKGSGFLTVFSKCTFEPSAITPSPFLPLSSAPAVSLYHSCALLVSRNLSYFGVCVGLDSVYLKVVPSGL